MMQEEEEENKEEKVMVALSNEERKLIGICINLYRREIMNKQREGKRVRGRI